MQTRNQTTKVVLQSIIDVFRKKLSQSVLTKFITFSEAEIIEEWNPNYSTSSQNQSGTIDIWDAIVLDCEIDLIPKCIN